MDEERYGELLREIRPRIIDSPEEHERLMAVAENLMEKGDELSSEEREALALIVLLIEAFETHVLDDDEEDDEGNEDQPPAPCETLRRLLQNHGLDAGDIAHIFGNPIAAREALEGSKPINRGQAKELAKFFRVPVKLFQEQ